MLILPILEDKSMLEITATELKEMMDSTTDLQLIDVREPDEYAFASIDGARLIPLGSIIRDMDQLDQSRDCIVHCKMGGRSARAIEAMQQRGFAGSLSNLVGGITAWSNDVDPSIAKY